MAFKFKDKDVIAKMPKIGDIIIKDRGEVKDSFIVVKEYENYFLAVAQRLKFRECFTKTSFALKEFKIQRKDETLMKGVI